MVESESAVYSDTSLPVSVGRVQISYTIGHRSIGFSRVSQNQPYILTYSCCFQLVESESPAYSDTRLKVSVVRVRISYTIGHRSIGFSRVSLNQLYILTYSCCFQLVESESPAYSDTRLPVSVSRVQISYTIGHKAKGFYRESQNQPYILTYSCCFQLVESESPAYSDTRLKVSVVRVRISYTIGHRSIGFSRVSLNQLYILTYSCCFQLVESESPAYSDTRLPVSVSRVQISYTIGHKAKGFYRESQNQPYILTYSCCFQLVESESPAYSDTRLKVSIMRFRISRTF